MSPTVREQTGRRRAQLESRAAAKTLRRLAESRGTIVAGPWLAPPGHELLYWIPLLNWLTGVAGVDRKRVVAISRCGADAWYADVAGRYVDVVDHLDADEVHSLRHLPPTDERVVRIGKRMFEVALEGEDPSEVEWLQPSLLQRLFAPRWDWGAGSGLVRAYTLQKLLPDDETTPPVAERPYVALQASFNRWFPDTEENRAFRDRLTEQLESRTRVVDAWGPVSERERLAFQTRVVRDADVLISTDLHLAYLGPYVATPTVALYSRAGFSLAHHDEIERVGRRLVEGNKRLYRARHIGHLAAAVPA